MLIRAPAPKPFWVWSTTADSLPKSVVPSSPVVDPSELMLVPKSGSTVETAAPLCHWIVIGVFTCSSNRAPPVVKVSAPSPTSVRVVSVARGLLMSFFGTAACHSQFSGLCWRKKKFRKWALPRES